MPSQASSRSNASTTISSEKPRLSLRERCHVTLTVQTTLNERTRTSIYHALEERLDDLRRSKSGRKYTPVVLPTPSPAISSAFSDDGEYDSESDSEEVTDPSYKDDSLYDASHLEEILDGLYVAYANDENELAALRTFYDREFSHILQVALIPPIISSPMSVRIGQLSGGRSEEMAQGGRQTRKLRLAVPALPRIGHTQILLSASQLLAARDFLALAMPYKNCYFPSVPRRCCSVDLVIVAPVGRKADILAVLTCYLAYVSGKHAGTVLRYMGETDEYDTEWKGGKGVVAAKVVEMVEKVARSG
ncbi:hypothetical protein J3A83DRAFT_1044171 [Scleroderma citrinum]